MIEIVTVFKYNSTADESSYQISINGMLVGSKIKNRQDAHIIEIWLQSALDEIIDLRDRELI